MFIGHFAVGFAAKKAAPRTSLAILIGAALWADILWPVLVLTGLERVRIDPGNTAMTPLAFDSYPYSHSLVADLGWATVLALIYFAVTRYRTGSVWVGVGVMSHWVLDFISHRPDMPVDLAGNHLVGLGLWNSVPATVIVEGGLFAASVGLYAKATRSKDRIGSIGFWLFVAFLGALYVADRFSPPPPSAEVVAWTGISFLPCLLWIWWFDRHRVV
jgi:hypothetical protein